MDSSSTHSWPSWTSKQESILTKCFITVTDNVPPHTHIIKDIDYQNPIRVSPPTIVQPNVNCKVKYLVYLPKIVPVILYIPILHSIDSMKLSLFIISLQSLNGIRAFTAPLSLHPSILSQILLPESMATIVEVTAHTQFPIKLTSTNFPVLATLVGLGLDSYVDGSKPAPPKLLPSDATKSNPEYLPWYRQDQILLGALLGSCSDTIQPIVSAAETSHQAFKRLTESYASVSRSRIISLKSRLANNPKGTRSVTEFLHDMKQIADDLALAQSPVDEEDLVVHILSQLGDDYTHIASALKIRDTAITFPDLFDKLVDHERTLKEVPPAPLIATVNHTQKYSNRQPSRAGSDNRFQPRFNNTGSRPPRFQGQSNNNINNNSHRGNRNFKYCQYCNIPSHETKDCRKLARFLKENNITISMNAPTNASINTSSARPTSPNSTWMFDSGASHHVASNSASFYTLSEYGRPDEIVLGNGNALPISHTGYTTLPTSSRPLHLNNILFVPKMRNNLVSVAKLSRANHVSVEFFPFHFLVKDLRTGAPLMRGVNINDIYYAALHSLRRLPQIHSTTTSTKTIASWHHKLGHPSTKIFKFLLRTLGIPTNKMSDSSFHCDACSINKSHKLPFGVNSFKASKPLELVYSDVWGPVSMSNDGFTYYVIFVDYYSKYIWLYPMKHKSDVALLFPQFRTLVEKYYNTPLVSLFTDNGGEFIGLTSYLQQNGISHFTTPPHTPKQNGIAERRHRHIVETGLSLLHQAHLPISFWSHAFQMAVYLINRLPTPILDLKSPYDQLHHVSPTYSKLKPFGCLCFPWLRPYTSSKLQPRSTKCIFLGYSSSKSAYKCFDPSTRKLYHSRHVEFVEHIFPYQITAPDSLHLPTADAFTQMCSSSPQNTPPDKSPPSPEPCCSSRTISATLSLPTDTITTPLNSPPPTPPPSPPPSPSSSQNTAPHFNLYTYTSRC
ncbi:hypothetical protein LXL04_010371 [Taraxacum kok-saghyz]